VAAANAASLTSNSGGGDGGGSSGSGAGGTWGQTLVQDDTQKRVMGDT